VNRLAWNPNTEPDLAHYTLYRDTVPNTMLFLTDISNLDTTYSDTNIIPGQIYYYTLTASDTAGDESIPTRTIAARDGTPIALKPLIEPDGGSFFFQVTVTLVTTTPEAEIHYTIDGSTPTLSSPLYSGPFLLTSDATVNAIAFKNGYEPSEMATAAFNVTTGTGIRVEGGLLALYTFLEGGGLTVNDVSDVGTPLDLTIDSPGNTSWGTGFLSINSATIIKSSGPASKLNSACMASNEITIEAWIKADNTTQFGPARIVSLSADPFKRNFTLGQSGLDYDIRLRTTTTGVNGNQPSLTAVSQVNTTLQHVIYTREESGLATIYIDGTQVAVSTSIAGDFSNWNSNFALGLANELTLDRSWLGELYLVAVYDRALTAQEVLQNYSAGPNPGPITNVDRDSGSDVLDYFKLQQNYPNPFNPTTQIKYALPRAENVSIIIYNLIGQRVKTLISQNQTAGNYSVIWDATDDTGQKLGSGLYFYVLQAGEYRAVKKMMLLK
jgi:hypothetical protein